MEIRISHEVLVKVLWALSVALGVVGFLMFIAGIIFALTAENSVSALRAIAAVCGGLALAVIPASVAHSVANVLSAISEASEDESE